MSLPYRRRRGGPRSYSMAADVCWTRQEFVLWSLVEHKKLSKYRYAEGVQFKDPYGSFISGL